MLARCLYLVVWFTAACAGSAPPPGPANPANPPASAPERGSNAQPTPAQALRATESRLLQAPWLRIASDIRASGAVAVEVRVEVAMMTDNRLRFSASGSFAGQPVSLCYISDGTNVRNGPGTGGENGEKTPGELNRAVVVGWVRMGFLHNVAMLFAGKGPDHADGGVATWVQTVRERWAPARVSPAANERVIEFDLQVASQPAGRVSLTTDATTDLPAGRIQVVQFPEGEMRVVESYRYLRDNPPGQGDFDIAAGCPLNQRQNAR